eukprot:scaffold24629_cov71-Skeletonema_dohrnii-CCMP3373.AAC.2
MHSKGKGVEKDTNKAVYHWEQAAIRGHPISRYNLAVLDTFNGRLKRATKHWIISACIGHDSSLERLKFGYMRGYVEKGDFAAALRGHQAALNATKSPQRSCVFAMLIDEWIGFLVGEMRYNVMHQSSPSEEPRPEKSGKSDRRLSVKSSPREALATQAKEAPRHADLERVLRLFRRRSTCKDPNLWKNDKRSSGSGCARSSRGRRLGRCGK